MVMEEFIQAYDSFRENGVISLLEDSLAKLIPDISEIDISNLTIHEKLNSYFSFALCSPSGMSLRSSALQFISKLADNSTNRSILIKKFTILLPLVQGIRQWKDEKIWLDVLEVFFKCTVDIHHVHPNYDGDVLVVGAKEAINLLKKSDSDSMTEISLGILANVSRLPFVIHKTLRNRNDFEALRKVLMQIMNAETSNQIHIVLSMTIRFQLWSTNDKFFEGQNFHTTVQVLFNILLNGEFTMASLYAGEILTDFFLEPSSFKLIKSYPHLNQALQEMVNQLASKNSQLILKFLNILSCAAKADGELCEHIRNFFFAVNKTEAAPMEDGTEPQPNKTHSNLGLSSLNEHILQPDNLLSAASAVFISDLEISFAATPKVTKLSNFTDYNSSLLQLLSIVVQGLSGLLQSNAHESSGVGRGTNFIQRLKRTHHLVLCGAVLVQRQMSFCSTLDTESIEMSTDHVSRLAFVVQALVQIQLNQNVFLCCALNGGRIPTLTVDQSIMLAQAALTVECLDLLLTCTDLLAVITAPEETQKSQQGDDETRIDCTPENMVDDMTGLRLHEPVSHISSPLRRCGDALQAFLETPAVAPLLAFMLAVGDGEIGEGSNKEHCEFPASRRLRGAVLRLLRVALHLQKFSASVFIDTLEQLLPSSLNVIDGYFASRLHNLKGSSASKQKPTSLSFLAKWLVETELHTVKGSGDQLPGEGKSHSSSSRHCSESALGKLVAAMESNKLSAATIAGSEALAICQRKIDLLQSREDVLEANVNAKSEALREADRISEHFRMRAAAAEAEVSRLMDLQFMALVNAEEDQTLVSNQAATIERMEEKGNLLSSELNTKRQECEALNTSKQNLQNKLTNMRDQNRAMDATIDNYRKQLDEAKQLLHQKDIQIEQHVKITQLINNLTGNLVPSNELVANQPGKTSATP